MKNSEENNFDFVKDALARFKQEGDKGKNNEKNNVSIRLRNIKRKLPESLLA